MANKEVCEVFIEQQIEEGLEAGKKPYQIGKDLSAWVEKLFAAKIPVKTIASRATRANVAKHSSNEENDVTPESETEKEPNQDIKSETWTKEDVKGQHGGKREGAGKPRKTYPVSTAADIVDYCVSQLRRLRSDDPERVVELQRLRDHVTNLLEGE